MKDCGVSQKLQVGWYVWRKGEVLKLEIQVNIRPGGMLSSIVGNYNKKALHQGLDRGSFVF